MRETAITLTSVKVPAHIKEAAGLGNENVSAEHLQTPRVKLLQQLNNEVDENHNDYIKGTKPGDLINTVTRENYGKELYVINVFFKEDFVLWKKRESGGGLVGTYPSQQAALSYLEQEGLSRKRRFLEAVGAARPCGSASSPSLRWPAVVVCGREGS